MYTPPAFAQSDQAKLHDFIEQHSFATLVTADHSTATASHLPVLLEREAGSHGRLIGHMARANPQWRGADGNQALAIFGGPHAYISPSWYESKNVVPTWNYAAVHAYGTFRVIDNKAQLLEIVSRYVDFYEQESEIPWSLQSADADFVDKLLDAIIGFEIEIDRVEGKWKLSQNHDVARRSRVIRALRKAGGDNREQTASLMSQTLRD